MKRRAIVEVLTALKEPDARPAVTISRVSGGEITYSVRASGRSLRRARLSAQQAFEALRAFVVERQAIDLKERMEKSR